MKITFYSNFLNHHQLGLCLEFYNYIGNGFTFVATTPVDIERKELGYADMNEEYEFVLCAYQSNENFKKARILGIESDIVILGAAPLVFVKNRIKKNKITFYYSERIFKPSFPIKKYSLRMIRYMFVNFSRFYKKNFYLLCAGSYVSSDFLLYGAFKRKQFKWGYFPNINITEADIISKKNKSEAIKLLWVGRFLEWKHPKEALTVTKKLLKNGYNIQLTMIGNGELLEEIKKQSLELKISDFVSFFGAIPYTDIIKHMLESDIFLFLSDYEEGWGAVLNEAMGCGCAVIANTDAGATNYLIKNGYNGLIIDTKSLNMLDDLILKLVTNKELREKIAYNAFSTIHNEWNAGVAASRLMEISKGFINGSDFVYKEGLCSNAEL